MIHRDNQRRTAQGVDFRCQLLQPGTGFEIAAEQDDPADQWMQQALAVFGGQLSAGDIEHHRSEGHGWIHFSSTTQAQARLDSSLMVR